MDPSLSVEPDSGKDFQTVQLVRLQESKLLFRVWLEFRSTRQGQGVVWQKLNMPDWREISK